MKYVYAYGSRQGGRAHNEDRVAVAERDRAIFMVLGDGLGGHKGGALASETLCRVAINAFRAVRSPLIQDPSNFLALVAFQAHHSLRTLGKKLPTDVEPRTTCVLCLVQNGCAYWAHVGDSRLYHFHHDTLAERTQDHTVVDKLQARGILDERESRIHPEKSRLLACLGGHHEPTVSLSAETPLKTGDLLVLCSDGVWEAMATHEFARSLAHPVLENGLTDLLLEAEHRGRGTSDNISAVSLRWQDASATPLGLAPHPRRLTAEAFWSEGQKLAVHNKLRDGMPPKAPS